MVNKKLKTTPAVACIKILLIVFTTILLIIGICLFAGGIYSKVELGGYDLLTTMNYSSAPYVMIGIGVFIIIAGIFGSVAIAKGNTCMLRTYAVVLGVLFLAEFIFAIVVAVFQKTIQSSFETGTRNALKNYTTDADISKAMNNTQEHLDCCGSNNYTDYWTIAGLPRNHVPVSCCKSTTSCHGFTTTDKLVDLPPDRNASDIINEIGCPAKVFSTVDENLAAILGTMFGVAAFQLVGLILSCCLASTINANKYELV